MQRNADPKRGEKAERTHSIERERKLAEVMDVEGRSDEQNKKRKR